MRALCTRFGLALYIPRFSASCERERENHDIRVVRYMPGRYTFCGFYLYGRYIFCGHFQLAVLFLCLKLCARFVRCFCSPFFFSRVSFFNPSVCPNDSEVNCCGVYLCEKFYIHSCMFVFLGLKLMNFFI